MNSLQNALNILPSNLADRVIAEQLAMALEEKARRRNENQLKYYQPYAKQNVFHTAGATHRERLLMAGNQLGKTLCAAAETAIHATGRYPDYWQGRKFPSTINGWVASKTTELYRDNAQRLLLGRQGQIGTGLIPKETIVDYTSARGVTGAIDTVFVRHVSSGISQLKFKTYDAGRESWQGETLDLLWLDEEPPMPIYMEGITRTNTTGGMIYLTFTPLLGMSDVVRRFLQSENQAESEQIGVADRHVTRMTIYDAEHYTDEQRKQIIASYPEHERRARIEGVPALGSGRVFPIAREIVSVAPFSIPPHWHRILGMDLGHGDHPTALVWLAHDADTDTLYVYDVHKDSDVKISTHASAIRARGIWIPIAWPPDAGKKEPRAGEQIKSLYMAEGCKMLPVHAQFEDGNRSVEAGLQQMLTRMIEGQFKVFSHLDAWWQEFDLYHRKDGLIVKEFDDLLDATRYGYMMRRFAIPKPQDSQRIHRAPLVYA